MSMLWTVMFQAAYSCQEQCGDLNEPRESTERRSGLSEFIA